MSLTAALLILIAGIVAGAVNVIIGGGSLITFPTLLALGYPPVLANVTNCVGMNPGNVSGVLSYRPELVGQRDRAIRLGSAVLLGVGTFVGGFIGGKVGHRIPDRALRWVVVAAGLGIAAYLEFQAP